MMAIIVFVLIISLSYFQLKKLYKENNKHDAYVYIGFMLIATYLSIGQILDIYVPNPTNGIRLVFEPIQKWIFSFLS